MSRLVITASPLIERWSVTSIPRRDRAAWPPSPDTLFSAMVAAAASLGNACHPVLYWLEGLGNPSIAADLNPPRTEGIVHFSPVADRPTWEKGSKQQRWHNSVGAPTPVQWSWTIDTLDHIPAIESIVREITYIGSSRAPILAAAHVSDAPLGPNELVPDEHGSYRIRGIYPGRLDDLEAAFQRGERPKPSPSVGYAKAGEKPIVSRWGQMIPLRRVQGQRLYIANSVPITEAVRTALTKHLPDGAPGMLTGHNADGTVLTRQHMAVVPLPRVGDTYADGDVLGVGLLLPTDCSDEDYRLLIEGLGRWLGAGGHVEIGGIRWVMEVANGDPRRALRPDRFDGTAATWTSVTPVVCDRHPRRDLTLLDVVGTMCRDVGLPTPEHVEAAPYGQLTGADDSRRHRLGGRDYLGKQYTAHLRIVWPRKIPGPILLGRGRYFGLGVMLPAEEAA